MHEFFVMTLLAVVAGLNFASLVLLAIERKKRGER